MPQTITFASTSHGTPGLAAASGHAVSNTTTLRNRHFFEPFSRATGIEVRIVEWKDPVRELEAMRAAGTVEWDILSSGIDHLIPAWERGLLSTFDAGRVGGAERFASGTLHPWGLQNLIAADVLCVDARAFAGDRPAAFADFWNVERFPGKRALWRRMAPVIEQASIADGVAPASVYAVLATPEGRERALKRLERLAPHVLWHDTLFVGSRLLAEGKAVMALTCAHFAIAARERSGAPIEIVWDAACLNGGYWTLPKGAAGTDLAYQLIDFANGDVPQLGFAGALKCGPVTRSAIAKVPAALAPLIPTTPANQRNAWHLSGQFWHDHGDAFAARFRALSGG